MRKVIFILAWIMLLVLVSFVYGEELRKRDVSSNIEIPQALLDKSRESPEQFERVIILFSEKPGNRKSFIENLGGRIIYDYDIIEGIAVDLPAWAVERLVELENVIKIEEDKVYHTFLSESIPLINASDVHNGNTLSGIAYNGSGIKVCVVDTGIDYNHVALQGKVVLQKCYCSINPPGPATACCPNSLSEDNDAMDDNGHGTHVAGIVASQNETYKGVGLGASLMAVKVLDSSGSGYMSDIIKGIEWCSDNSADVVSMSLGGGLYGSYCDGNSDAQAVNNAADKGSVVVVASGNDASVTEISSPACASKAISVGASYDANVGSKNWIGVCSDSTTYADKIVCFTNRNNILDVLAPGAITMSTKLGGGFIEYSGTSMATPHVAGVVALLLQEDSGLTAEKLNNILNYTGIPIYDSGSDLSFPRVDALAAIDVGKLESYLITDDMNIAQNQTFSFQAGVNCTGGRCGDVDALLKLGFDFQPITCSQIWGFDCGEGPPENFDNTYDGCSIGNGLDESIKEVYLNKNKVGFGEEIEVKCEVEIKSLSCGDAYVSDNLYIYYRNNSVGTWTQKKYVPQIESCENYSITFIPDSIAGEHQVRCITGYNILVTNGCGIGTLTGGIRYYDNDDTNFTAINNNIPENSGNPFYTNSSQPQTCTNMQSGSNCEFEWNVNATGDLGTYKFFSIMSSNLPISQAESEKVNITIIGLSLQGDVNNDCVVDILDLSSVGFCFGLSPTGGCESSDINFDGFIDILDLSTVGFNFGNMC